MDEKRPPLTAEGHIHNLRDLAIRLRRALEQCDPQKLPPVLQSFPRGACGVASLLLAKYLEQQGYHGAKYICGQLGEHAHAWLEINGVILDITADQFEHQQEPVIVMRDSPWHASFPETPIKTEAAAIAFAPASGIDLNAILATLPSE